jgi:hypothetical protein
MGDNGRIGPSWLLKSLNDAKRDRQRLPASIRSRFLVNRERDDNSRMAEVKLCQES